MEIALAVASVVLLFICVILLIILLRNTSNKGSDEAFKQALDNIEDENRALGSAMQRGFAVEREERERLRSAVTGSIDQGLDRVNKRIEEQTRSNYEQRDSLKDTLTASLTQLGEKQELQSEKQGRQIAESVAALQKSNEEKLDQMRRTVDEKLDDTLTKRLDSSFKNVSDRLVELYRTLGEMKQMSGEVTGSVNALSRVLTNVKARGTWAEVQLGNILDETIPGMYVRNYKPSGCSGFVEFAIKMPVGEEGETVFLPLDSKFPTEDYRRLTDAADSGDKDAFDFAVREIEKRLCAEAKAVSKYINVPETTPYAIMYLATEGLYAQAIASREGIVEKIQREYSVMIAGPSTITALLNSFSMGFKAMSVNRRAKDIADLLEEVRKQYDTFSTLIIKAKKSVTEAGDTLDSAVNRNEIMQKKLRKIDMINPPDAHQEDYN